MAVSNETAWNFALGLNKMAGLEVSDEMLEMIEMEKRGEITMDEILERLDKKYNIKRDENGKVISIQTNIIEEFMDDNIMKMEIRLDEAKFCKDSEYTIEQVYKRIDEEISRRGIWRQYIKGFYIGNADSNDFCNFANIVTYLKNQEWFLSFVKTWLFYAEGGVEDLAEQYKNNKSEELCRGKKITKKTKEIHKMYEECQKVFEPSAELLDEISNIENETEKLFYITLCDFFMQQKQKELIENGIY